MIPDSNPPIKISIITAVLDRKDHIKNAIFSVSSQSHQNIEHIIVDGQSKDGTLEIVRDFALNGYVKLLSGKDGGIYEALNKGIEFSTGDVIGILHSDDIYASTEILKVVASIFEDEKVDMVYGDLVYVDKFDQQKIRRIWKSKSFKRNGLIFGWMPPHPTLFLRARVFKIKGSYDPSFKISGDYDYILRCFSDPKLISVYIPRLIVRMCIGGVSNNRLTNIYKKWSEDLWALQKNNIGSYPTLFCKIFRKFPQFLI